MTLEGKIDTLKKLKDAMVEYATETNNLLKEGVELEKIEKRIKYYDALDEYYNLNEQIILDEISTLGSESKVLIESYFDEVINEALTIYRSDAKGKKQPAILIRIDNEDDRAEGFIKDPYLGIYDGSTFNNSNNMVRVGLLDGRLLNHDNAGKKGGLGHLPKNSDQLKWFLSHKDDYKHEIYEYLSDIAKKDHYTFDYKEDDLLKFDNYTESRSKDKLSKVNK